MGVVNEKEVQFLGRRQRVGGEFWVSRNYLSSGPWSASHTQGSEQGETTWIIDFLAS